MQVRVLSFESDCLYSWEAKLYHYGKREGQHEKKQPAVLPIMECFRDCINDNIVDKKKRVRVFTKKIDYGGNDPHTFYISI